MEITYQPYPRIGDNRRPAMLSLMVVGLLAAVLSGCSALLAPTATPLIVTATPLPTETPPPATSTPVIGGVVTPSSADLTFAAMIPTATLTATPNLAAVISTLPTSTATVPVKPPSLTPSFTITLTDSPEPTGVPGQPSVCGAPAAGGFGTIYSRDPALQQALGCPVSLAVAITVATQDFEQGRMVWASQLADVPTRTIYVLYNNGTFARYDDTWTEGVDPESGGETAPAGRVAPIRGFGKVWRSNAPVQQGLGWALAGEVGAGAQIQRFERGEMIYVSSINQTFIFIAGSGWRLDPTPY